MFEPNVKGARAYQDADKWYHEHAKERSPNSALALEYAQREYEGMLASMAQIEAKAESLLKLAGVIASAVGSLATVFPTSVVAQLFLATSVVLFVLAMFVAQIAKRTTDYERPLTVANLLSLDPVYDARFLLAASHHVAMEGLAVTNRWKASRVDSAMWLLFAGAAVLASYLVFELVSLLF